MQRIYCLLLLVLFVGGVGTAPAQERVVPDDVAVRLTITLQTGQVVNGRISAFDEIAFTLTSPEGEGHRIPWTTIPAAAVDRYWRFLVQPEGDAEALFELGMLLMSHRDGRPMAQVAFNEAVELDDGLAERARAILAGEDPGESFRRVGEGDPAMWGELDAELMDASTADLRAFCQRTATEMQLQLRLFESARFIVCTDLDEEWVRDLSVRLTEIYRTTAELLGEDPDGNLFRGKCLIFIFDRRVDYLRFQRDLHETDARGTGGLCHGFGDGHVHIAAFRRTSETQTHHVVVHEVVHGMLHRYRSPVPLPDWVNEGLAEHLAHRVVTPASGASLYNRAVFLLEGKTGLGEGFYEGEHLEQWQYPVAGAMAEFMIERSDTAYLRFIDAIKDGEDWPDALGGSYRMDDRRLTLRFKQRLSRALNERLGQ